jgi:hypothetical protein
MVQMDRQVTRRKITHELNLQNVSLNTISNRIKESGEFFASKQTRKPFVSETNRLKRLKWCEDHLDWTIEQWEKVIWSDESPFVLFYSGRSHCWKKKGEGFNPQTCKATVKHDKKIMVWGCFSAHKVGKLYRVRGIMDQDVYHNILVNQFMPSKDELFPDGDYIFQQDNDPKHTARKNKTYLESKSVPVLPWPAQSPDLNPIENLWSILDGKLADRKPSNEEQLFQTLLDGWNALPVDLLRKLVYSMPRRCAEVIENKGWPTKY